MNYLQVIVPQNGLFALTYATDKKNIAVGTIVQVSIRNKISSGIVISLEKNINITSKIKPIENISEITVSLDVIEFIKKSSEYYLQELGTFTKLTLPVNIFEAPIKFADPQIINPARFKLAKLETNQQSAINQLLNNPKTTLIRGVTGSGKTEIYFHYIAYILQQNKSALILLPEIAICNQIADRFAECFGFKAHIWHSDITKAGKKKLLRSIINGDTKIVIGTRSALYLPFKNLGVIIADEEHDPSYKQNDGLLYHARDMAVLRGSISGAKTILLSATPSIESLYNVSLKKYDFIQIDTRYNEATMPIVEVVDLRQDELAKGCWISNSLQQKISKCLEAGEQTIIFLNRRGYAPLMICKECGYRFDCYNCSSSLVMHKAKKCLKCHHCGYLCKIPNKCTNCSSVNLTIYGPGIERVYEELCSLYPDKTIAILTKEQSSKTAELADILAKMQNGDIDILIGTQLITKGYHFPMLTLVGIIDCDMSMRGGDFRSSEKTFQLLHQVSGRAGRQKNKQGTVILQTYNPDSKVIKFLQENNIRDFINYEMRCRSQNHTPPYSKMAALYFSGRNEKQVKEFALQAIKHAPKSSATILGPAEALMYKVQKNYRYRLLIIANRNFSLQKYISNWKKNLNIPSSINFKIDIDPQQLL